MNLGVLEVDLRSPRPLKYSTCFRSHLDSSSEPAIPHDGQQARKTANAEEVDLGALPSINAWTAERDPESGHCFGCWSQPQTWLSVVRVARERVARSNAASSSTTASSCRREADTGRLFWLLGALPEAAGKGRAWCRACRRCASRYRQVAAARPEPLAVELLDF